MAGTYFFAGQEAGKEIFGVGRVGIDTMKEVSAKDEVHKISNYAMQNKVAHKPVATAEFQYKINE